MTAVSVRTIPEVAVIVVTFNSEATIERCLRSLLSQNTKRSLEVLVVDSGSADSTPSIVQGLGGVRFLSVENRGFGAANNAGVRETEASVVAFANPDTVADPEWLEALIAALLPSGTITTSQILLLDRPDRINTLGLELHFCGLGLTRLSGEPAVADPSVQEVAGFSGAAFAIRRADYLGLGGFDERIFLYNDDTELSWRARRAGFTILAVPSSRIWHDYRPALTARKLFHLERSRRIILRRHFSPTQRLAYAPSLFVMSLLSMLRARLLGRDALHEWRRARWDARKVSPGSDGSPAARPSSFAAWQIPSAAFGPNRLTRGLSLLPNLVFLLNTLGWRLHGRRF